MAKRTRPHPAPVAVAPLIEPRTWIRFALLALGFAVALAYCNTLNVPFVFDDFPTIEKNRSIRDLADLGAVLQPPSEGGSGVSGRPVINLTLAINNAISGLKPWSYHLANTLIHALSAVTLFGLIRRSLQGPVLNQAWGTRAVPVAFVISLLWAVHPLQTESVTCIIQRTESLLGLFYLFTLYSLARFAAAPSPSARLGWGLAGVAASLLGMGTKEVMVTVPVVALLYDRTFLSGTFRGVLRHRWLHYGLFASWALLLLLLQGNPMRGGTAGFEKVTSWDYLLTSCRGIVIYLKLAFWPHPLVLDYGTVVERSLLRVLPQALLLTALAGGTAYALVKRPVAGFLGAWFFIILSPSSSVVPLVTQTIAEHRMYLPLLSVVALVVGLLAQRAPGWLLPAGLGLAAVLGLVTLQRNGLYRRPHDLWTANRTAWPENERVYGGLANAADEAGDFVRAVGYYEAFLERRPEDAKIRFNYARVLVKAGRRQDAMPQFEQVLKMMPESTEARTNYAANLLALEQWDEGIRQLELILRLGKGNPVDNFNLAEAYRKRGRLPEALVQYEKSAAARPKDGFLHYRYGDTLMQLNRPADAIPVYRIAVEDDPALFAAWMNLGGACLMVERPADAVAAYEAAVRLKPGDPAARQNLDYARSQLQVRR